METFTVAVFPAIVSLRLSPLQTKSLCKYGALVPHIRPFLHADLWLDFLLRCAVLPFQHGDSRKHPKNNNDHAASGMVKTILPANRNRRLKRSVKTMWCASTRSLSRSRQLSPIVWAGRYRASTGRISLFLKTGRSKPSRISAPRRHPSRSLCYLIRQGPRALMLV